MGPIESADANHIARARAARVRERMGRDYRKSGLAGPCAAGGALGGDAGGGAGAAAGCCLAAACGGACLAGAGAATEEAGAALAEAAPPGAAVTAGAACTRSAVGGGALLTRGAAGVIEAGGVAVACEPAPRWVVKKATANAAPIKPAPPSTASHLLDGGGGGARSAGITAGVGEAVRGNSSTASVEAPSTARGYEARELLEGCEGWEG